MSSEDKYPANTPRREITAFDWWVPMMHLSDFLKALLIVALLCIAVVSGVKVNFGIVPKERASQASVILIPYNDVGKSKYLYAVEQGPFPWQSQNQNMQELETSILYNSEQAWKKQQFLPKLQPIHLEQQEQSDFAVEQLMVLPEPPKRAQSNSQNGKPAPGKHKISLSLQILGNGDTQFIAANLEVNAEESTRLVGLQFLLHYEENGKIIDVVNLSGKEVNHRIRQWMRSGNIINNEKEGASDKEKDSKEKWVAAQCIIKG